MRRGVALFVLVAFATAVPSASGAEFGIAPGSVSIELLDAGGAPETRAGSHPDLMRISFGLEVADTGTTARDLVMELPAGLGGNPAAVPACPRATVEADEPCPDESQIGVNRFIVAGFGELALPLYQVEPTPGQLLSLGSLPGLGAGVEAEMRPEDAGITVITRDLPQDLVMEGGHLELWGIPADRQQGTSIPRRAFLTAPTRCGPLSFTLRTRSWQDGAPWLSATAESIPLSGCESLAFDPQLEMQLTNPRADSSSGLRMTLNLPESSDPDGLASAQLREATFEMPEGVTISPASGVAGVTCSDAQFGLGSNSEVTCPAGSKVGATEVFTPSSETPLEGSVYLGEGRPGEPFRMLIVAGGGGVLTKFSGTMEIDRTTGQISTTMKAMPLVAIERLRMEMGGESGQLATPLECGRFQGAGRFQPHGGGPQVVSTASVSVEAAPDGSACPPSPPFSPRLTTTVSSTAAGKPTAIAMAIERQAGEQLPRRFAVTMPSGLSTAMKGLEICADAALSAGACPPGSRVGSATFAIGVGQDLLSQQGDVFMGGPYRGAPFSIVMAFHSSVGGTDLGTTAIRSALRIDPASGRATVESDPMQAIVEGIPLRLRAMKMTLDRPGMVRNPTSCRPAAFDTIFEANSGATARTTSGLRVTGCRKLGFRPRVEMALTGRGQMHEGGRPGLRMTTRLRQGDTTLRDMHFSLPKALKFRLAGLGEICSRHDAAAQLCSPKARIGTSVAYTPILGDPLKGSVYIVQPSGDGRPDLWVSMVGAGMRMSMRGTTSVRDGKFVSHMTGLPDMPLSRLSMRLRGGRRGIMALAVAPCGRKQAGALSSSFLAKGQNGVVRKLRLTAKAPCRAAD